MCRWFDSLRANFEDENLEDLSCGLQGIVADSSRGFFRYKGSSELEHHNAIAECYTSTKNVRDIQHRRAQLLPQSRDLTSRLHTQLRNDIGNVSRRACEKRP